jgi:maltose 6'-phosphate phosphatase
MKAIQLLQAENTLARHKQRLCQELVFVMLVENIAFEKLVEVHWAGEDKVWHTLKATYCGPAGENQEIWRAQVTLDPSEGAKLQGNVEFVLHYRVSGQDYWDKAGVHNYVSGAGCGLLLGQSARLLNIDFNPVLSEVQRYHPVTVAVRHSLRPSRVYAHWTTDNWRSAHIAPCFLTMHQEEHRRGGAGNPFLYGTGTWITQIEAGKAFRVEYAIGCKTRYRTIWDNNFGRNYVARRRRLKILTLNLHCYQEENQDAKFSQIAKAIDDLDIDIVCLQEVAEPWEDGKGNWDSNAAKIIRDRLRRHYHLHTDWSHIGFDRYREGIAVLSRYGFLMTDADYVSSCRDVRSIDSRKAAMVQVNVPYMGLLNVFSVHLSWPSGGFYEQFERLRVWANRKHGGHLAATFLCGDFNIKAGSRPYEAIAQAREYEDQYLAAASPDAFQEIFRNQPRNTAGLLAADDRIDFVFMRKYSRLNAVAAWPVFTAEDDYGRVSDHVGYCVEFEPDW